VSLAEAMRACGLDPERAAEARRDDIETFLELHIEQGPVLEQHRTAIGIVEAITALDEMEFTVEGRADHAGGFPMDARLDPMIATAEMVLEITRLARELGPPAVATIGRISAAPGAPNIVAATVRFTVDVRYPDPARHRRLVERIQDGCRAIAARHGVALRAQSLASQPPTQSSPELVALMCRAADDLGLPYLRMVSGAGHDTQVLARRGVRRAMIFVPSRDGRSHSPDEYTALDDIIPGVTLLAETLYRLAYA
jgi:allantoate deiminase